MKRIVFLNFFALIFILASCTSKTDSTTNIMSFNIRLDAKSDGSNNWEYRKENIIKMLNYYSPDIIGMQEVLKNQLQYLKTNLPQYTQLGVGREDGKEKGEFCPLFFNTQRYTLIQSGNFGLSENPDEIGKMGWDAACQRIVTWAILEDNSTREQIAVFNTHYDHVGKTAKRESSNLILSKIQEIAHGIPVVITGDFNSTIESEPITTLLNGGLIESSSISGVKYGNEWSYCGFGSVPLENRRIIDFILVSKEIKVKKHSIIGDKPDKVYLSDHTPILTEITY